MAAVDLVLAAEVIGEEPEAELNRWMVADGGTVEAGQAVAEMTTSKVVLELQSPASGVLRHIVPEGAVVAVGDVVARIISA
jgi:pyruvate/2-oxoglutarate dehydrogenase complex dihydrolipoamide acyltransferase (E2) component